MVDVELPWWEEAGSILRAVVSLLEGRQLWFDSVPPIHIHNLYLVSSHLYYKRHMSMMQDGTYDELCKWLYRHYDEIYCVIRWPDKTMDREAFLAGTGFHIPPSTEIMAISNAVIRALRS